MAHASYEEIIAAIGARLRTVADIGKVSDLDEASGPMWEKLHKPNQAYWEIGFASEEQQGKSGAGRQLEERAVFTIDGFMPIAPEHRSMRVWLRLIKAASNCLRADPTLGLKVSGSELPRTSKVEKGVAKWADTGREFDCHHVTIELTVKQFVAEP